MQASVIIPTRNRAASLRRTLASLVAQEYPCEGYEILVVNNASTDDTGEVVREALEQNPNHEIRSCLEPVPGLLSGRHRGAKEAQGDVIVFVDDDIEAVPGWLTAIVEAFRVPTVHMATGPSLPRYECPPPAWLEAFWTRKAGWNVCGYLSLLDLGELWQEIDPTWVWGLNYAIRRGTLFELGGFHPDCVPKELQRFQGDGETGLSLKAKTRGIKAVYHPRALVYHLIPASRLTIEYFEQRAFYQGVCDSFARVRAEGAARHPPLDWKRPLCLIKARLLELDGDKMRSFRTRVHQARLDGFAFHQREVWQDPRLLEWVLKPDYWDWDYRRLKAVMGEQ